MPTRKKAAKKVAKKTKKKVAKKKKKTVKKKTVKKRAGINKYYSQFYRDLFPKEKFAIVIRDPGAGEIYAPFMMSKYDRGDKPQWSHLEGCYLNKAVTGFKAKQLVIAKKRKSSTTRQYCTAAELDF
ncbi:MAG: hypothetical protein ACXABY_16345 [Candidatus Thorarchaeota archaeon]|jgi:hypothetical protein